MYLDSLTLLQMQVGYGDLGMHGSPGYEGLPVTVRRQHYAHALSTRPPGGLRFHIDRRFASFVKVPTGQLLIMPAGTVDTSEKTIRLTQQNSQRCKR